MNIRNMDKNQLKRRIKSLWREQDKLLAPYDCGQQLAEYMGPGRIREVRLELEEIEAECGRRNRLEQATRDTAYVARLSYNDAQERGAERCNECGADDPWYPRCKQHEPIGGEESHTMLERVIFGLTAITIGLAGWYIFDVLGRVSAGNPLGF